MLHLVTGAEEGWGQAGNPIPWVHWAWLVIDILVPMFFLRMLAAMRQRDALERALAAAAERDPLTGLANRAGFSRMGLVALAQAALAMVDRLRQAITQRVPHPGAPEHRLTLSAGIARIQGAGLAGMERAFDQADQALHAAKQAGRDRAVLARCLDGLDAAC